MFCDMAMRLKGGYQRQTGGTEGGTKCFLIYQNLAFMRVSRHLSIDPSPPDRNIKAANDIQLAAFFFGKSMTYAITGANGDY